jgi:hypothetical protein
VVRSGAAERFHVVTVPPAGSDPTLLWQRFAVSRRSMPSGSTPPAVGQPVAVVRPRGAVATRQHSLGDRMSWPAYETTVKGWFAEQLLVSSDSGPRASVATKHRGWFAARAAGMVEQLRQLEVDVVGDLADLEPAFGDPVDAPDPDVVVGAAADALAVLLDERARRHWTGRGNALAARARRSPAVQRLPDGVQRWLKRRVNE